MPVRCTRRLSALLLAAVLVLTLACTGSGEDAELAPATSTSVVTPTASATPSPRPVATLSPTATRPPTPTATPSPTPAATHTPTATAMPPPTVVATPADRCATATAADCIRAVYLGAPGDYAQVANIPADALLTPGSDGRYRVERGQQYTVVTAAPLPAGWTRFYLERTPLGTPSPVSAPQLIKPVGTTYTFTVTDDEAGATLVTFDLTAARPFVRPRPDGKPQLGDVVVTTVFSVVPPRALTSSDFGEDEPALRAGTYKFPSPSESSPLLLVYIPVSDRITWSSLLFDVTGVSICLSESSTDSELCIELGTGSESVRIVTDGLSAEAINELFDLIASSVRLGPDPE